MSVLIEMEIPKECHECPFQIRFKDGEADDWYARRCVIEHQIIEYPRPDWCPLKEAVPASMANHYDDGKHTRYVFYRTEEQL